MYNCKVYFILADNICGEVNKLYRKKKMTEVFEDDPEGVMVSFDFNTYYIIIDPEYLSHNTIAHELYHVQIRITDDRDIRDEEAGAWLSGHIAGQIYKFLDKKKLTIHHGD